MSEEARSCIEEEIPWGDIESSRVDEVTRERKRMKTVHPSTSDRLYSDEESIFLKEIDRRRSQLGRWMTMTEVLQLIKDMGYERRAV